MRTRTMQVHDAGGNFHDDDLSFDRNSVDDRPATVSHAMAEVLDLQLSKCERHVQ